MRLPIFDLDGTLVDSDDARRAPSAALGVPSHALPPMGPLLEEACEQVGISVADHLAAHDVVFVHATRGVVEPACETRPR